MAQTSIKAIIGPARFSYLHVFEPWKAEGEENDKLQYTCTLLIPKNDTALVARVKEAIQKAYDISVSEKWGGKKPADGYWHNPLQDGDSPKQDGEPRGEGFEGHYFINAKSRTQPGVIRASDRQPILNSEELYSGCYGYASVAFSGFSFNKKLGVSCFLNNVMMTKEGEPLGGARQNAADDFSCIPADYDTSEDM